MSDNEIDYEDEESSDEQPSRKTIEVDAADWRTTRKKAKQLEEAETRATAAERKLAIREAGLDISPRQLSALLKEHDGEFTAEALKETATELGFWKPPEEPDNDGLEALDRVRQATAGSGAAGAFDKESAIAQAQTPAEVLAAVRAAGGLVTSDIE
jgi:hypothetical protein